MPLPVIPRNTYPLHPVGYAAYWQVRSSKRMQPAITGHVPIWVSFHDGGGRGRVLHLLLVRVRPELEVVIVGKFRQETFVDEIERTVRERLSKPRWPERSWWVSHVVYLAQPPRRPPNVRRRGLNYQRFCMGRLVGTGGESRMLAFIPVARLKLNVLAASGDKSMGDAVDLRIDVDCSNREQRAVREYVTRLAALERWERRIVNRALGHLLGESYINAVITASEQIVGGDYTTTQKVMSDAMYSEMKSPPEVFRPVRWLRAPENDDDRRSRQTILAITRFPMGRGPDAEMSVRPWFPPALQGVVAPLVSIEPYANMALEVVPDQRNHDVAYRWVVNPLQPYSSG
jgi:hypothetical protein